MSRYLPALLVLALAPPLAAQTRMQVTPFVASYYPLAELNRQSGVPLPIIAGNPNGDIVRKQVSSPMLGARASMPLTGTIRLEGEFGWAFSSGRVAEIPTANPDASIESRATGHVFEATIRARLQPRRQNIFGILGAGLVGRGGAVWKDAKQSAKVAGVVGFGLHAAVNPSLSVEVGAEALLYSMSFTSASVPVAQSKFQQDILVWIGIPIPGR